MQQCLISIQLVKKNLKPAVVQVLPLISHASKPSIVLSSSHIRRTDCKGTSCLLPRPYPDFPPYPHQSLDLRPVAYAVFPFGMLSFPEIFSPFIQTGLVQGLFLSVIFLAFQGKLSCQFSHRNFNISLMLCLLYCFVFKRSVSSLVYKLFESLDHAVLIPVSKASLTAPSTV